MHAEMMPEPLDRALVGLFHPAGRDLPIVLERDDIEDAERGEIDHWFAHDNAYTWAQVLELAAAKGWQVVRLYRADDPAVTDAFNAGVKAAADAIESHAESIGWYEGDGVWAEAIEEARKAVKN
ncbi:hypothetical protein AB0I89_23520 [Micromonospora sp. NPDC049801]|uniref:hypothetical protein n=1 Tax=unclassified Micromonospora TaxID=2617518 RepID=UPI0033F1A394